MLVVVIIPVRLVHNLKGSQLKHKSDSDAHLKAHRYIECYLLHAFLTYVLSMPSYLRSSLTLTQTQLQTHLQIHSSESNVAKGTHCSCIINRAMDKYV